MHPGRAREPVELSLFPRAERRLKRASVRAVGRVGPMRVGCSWRVGFALGFELDPDPLEATRRVSIHLDGMRPLRR